MAKILEEIQTRLAEAQKKFADANQALALAQQAQAQAQHQFSVWQMALQIEQREEQMRQVAAAQDQNKLPLVPAAPIIEEDSSKASDAEDGASKTDIVRDLLGRHPAGMTAPEIWHAVNAQFKYRPYLYSVLKRLRDRDEVMMRRKKYFLKLATKIEEVVKEQQSFVH